MTRLQLRLVAALSLLGTLVVLGDGLRSGGGVDASALGAPRTPVTVSAPGLGGGGGASSADTSASGSESADAGAPADSSSAGGSTSGAGSGSGAGSSDGSSAGGEGAGTSVGGEGAGTSADSGARGGSEGSGGNGTGAGATTQPTRIRHVFLIVLAGHGFDQTFGAGSPATYLNGTLRPKGALLSGYQTLGRADLPDELAALGGQPPNASTRAGCPVYGEIPQSVTPDRAGIVSADGCVFPNTVTTLADQLDASRRSWRAYVEDLDRGPAPAPGLPPKTTCRHPGSNQPDPWTRSTAGDGYATRHNPFVYYHSLLDLGGCDADDGALTQLDHDLSTARDTPSLSWIVPDLCHDGTESPCADGSPGGLAAADAFLATWAPKVLASPAYRAGGLLVVTFAGDVAPPPAGAGTSPPADLPVREGMLLVSRWAQAGSTAAATYDPYALLHSLEDVFALRPLAKAATAPSFAPTVLANAYLTPPGDG